MLGITPAAGVLMTGPPGSGKTLFARAMAAESGMNFIPVRPARILSQFLGEAERAIAEIFTKARQCAPCLIFFDELDTLAPRRGRADAAQARLTELDGLVRNHDIAVLAATNRASAIDPALTRPGRFDVIVTLPLPDHAARMAILEVHTRRMPLAQDVDLDALAVHTEGMSGADLAALVGAASRHAVKRSHGAADKVMLQMEDFTHASRQFFQAQQARNDDYITGEDA